MSKGTVALFLALSVSAFATNDKHLKDCADRSTRVGRLIHDSMERFKLYSDHAREERWPVDGAHAKGDPDSETSYNGFFRRVLNKTFETVLEERKRAGKSTHVADFFGSALFLSNTDRTDSLTGVRLLPLRTASHERKIEEALKEKRQEILGNLYDPLTWDTIADSMKARRIPAFDLIVMRPWGALTQLEKASRESNVFPEMQATYCALIAKAYEKLSPGGGQLLVQIPGLRDEQGLYLQMTTRMRSWLEQLKTSGVEVIHDSYGAVRIIRNANSPAHLAPMVSN